MDDSVDILNNIIDAFKNALIASLQANGMYATGQTIQELQEVVVNKYAALLGPYWIDALEFGRKPTPPGTPAGDPTLREALIPWLTARGIPEEASYAIANKIHKFGYPGKPGVLSIPLGNDNIDRILAPEIDRIADKKMREIADLFNEF